MDIENTRMVESMCKEVVQYVFLDFDGADTIYRNEDLNMTIEVDVDDSGMSNEQKRYILAELSEKYANKNIIFTAEKPENIQQYSTIFIGQTDDFDEYGSFAGLAETIDKGNRIKNDNAFVLADNTCDTDLVISVIDHELGHIFEGMEHEYVSGDINDFAGSYHLYGPSLSLGTISCPATITGCVSGATFDTYHYTSYVTFSVEQSGYYTVLLRAQHASGGSTTVSGRVSGPPDIWDPITPGNSASFYFTAGEKYSIHVSIPMLAATNSSSVYNYTCTITSGGGSGGGGGGGGTSRKPDLTVSSFTVVNGVPEGKAGDRGFPKFTFTVKNQGGASSERCSAYIYKDGSYYTAITISALPAGGSATYTYSGSRSDSGGVYTVKVDALNEIAESNENNNTSQEVSYGNSGGGGSGNHNKPDDPVQIYDYELVPYHPSDWSDKLIVCKTVDGKSDSTSLTTADSLYFNCAVLNDSESVIIDDFDIAIYLDGKLFDTLSYSDNLSGGYYGYWTDNLSLGKVSAGTHTIKMVVDYGNAIKETNENNNTYSKTFTVVSASEPPSPPVQAADTANTNLLDNGYSQIVAWDKQKGTVGFVATNGYAGPQWRGVWDWNDYETSLWRVVNVGYFAGSNVNHDGILLYNGVNNTFAAWTNLNDPSYGYVSLCHVAGNFQTQCLTNLDGDAYDDVLIYDDRGSFGVVTDGTRWHSIWNAPANNTQKLIGAGDFGAADGLDSLLVKNTTDNAYFLWHNNDSSFKTWDWSQTYIGSLDNNWIVAGIGDFQGDGTDDIIMWQRSTGYMYSWEDGKSNNQRWVGSLASQDWEVAAVGDYNGDGKDDLLLRELNSGWGGLGYWASADASNWRDLNARIETDFESKFAVIA